MKKMLRQVFPVFETEALNNMEMRNYKYSFIQNFIKFWQMELVWIFFLFFFCDSTS